VLVDVELMPSFGIKCSYASVRDARSDREETVRMMEFSVGSADSLVMNFNGKEFDGKDSVLEFILGPVFKRELTLG
jgi:hypothetical protein